MNYPEIANRIKRLRIQKAGDKHGSQKEFADFLGVKYTTYVNYEKGRIPLEFLFLLKEKMGVSIEWLLTGEEAAPLRVAEEEAPYEPLPLYSPEEKEYIEKLVEVLRNPNTKKAIEQNIDTFLLVSRPEPEPKKKKD